MTPSAVQFQNVHRQQTLHHSCMLQLHELEADNKLRNIPSMLERHNLSAANGTHNDSLSVEVARTSLSQQATQ